MLLHRLRRGGAAGTRELQQRIRAFDGGRWDVLLEASRATVSRRRFSAAQLDPQARRGSSERQA